MAKTSGYEVTETDYPGFFWGAVNQRGGTQLTQVSFVFFILFSVPH